MENIFWFSYTMIGYVYFGYPLILTVLARLVFVKKKELDELPAVSMIVAAYNEEKVIQEKIEASLALDYPKGKLELIIASDASDDKTDGIVKKFKDRGVRLIRQDQRRGKTAAQNLAVKEAKGDVLVFSDATTVFERDAIKQMVKHFGNAKVGIVAGVEKFVDSKTRIAKEASFFWNYELYIREREGKINTMIGVSGCIFAVRKKLYGQLPEGLIEDFALPLYAAQKGYKTVQEPCAVAYEEAVADTKDEFNRKARIVAGGIAVLMAMKHLLNPLRYPVLSFQLFSHKLLRWLAPLFLILFFLTNMVLINVNYIYNILGVAQIWFYGLAVFSHILKKIVTLPKPLRIVYHFCLLNLSAFAGLWMYAKGSREVVWEPVRD